jgi:hypothetical protein
MTFSILSFYTVTLGIATLSIMTLRITTISIMSIFNDTQHWNIKHNDAQHNDTLHNSSQQTYAQHNNIQYNKLNTMSLIIATLRVKTLNMTTLTITKFSILPSILHLILPLKYYYVLILVSVSDKQPSLLHYSWNLFGVYIYTYICMYICVYMCVVKITTMRRNQLPVSASRCQCESQICFATFILWKISKWPKTQQPTKLENRFGIFRNLWIFQFMFA